MYTTVWYQSQHVMMPCSSMSTLRLSKTIKDSQHIPTIFAKGERFDDGINFGVGYYNEGAKIEVSGCELVAEICT